MNNVNQLMRSAAASAHWRGHTMGPWRKSGPTSVSAVCQTCGRTANADADPPANGIGIWGEAVAVGCTEERP